ncbi:Bet_v_1 domain-containing protein [Cephalotus follicularis]|uniref:Bet_v_1 domain-containing protein n=1 Tax=Cephalotus follicularis TaxID=3775 RepID=A0A1Q3D4K4_CEPFO|nr:Bet_v_1 domain-containing protein [Cephalotus follicularis]
MAQSSLFGSAEAELEINAPADKLYEALCNPQHMSKYIPENVTNVDLHEGEWGTVGSIVTCNCAIDGKSEVFKSIMESMDYENKSVTMKAIEGDIMKLYKSMKSKMQVIPKGEGSLLHLNFEYEKVNADVPDPNSMLNFSIKATKDLGAYLSRA